MRFSIVTPARNVGPWLEETIKSVLSQKGEFRIEYLIVTDPSDDDTVEIARRYTKMVTAGDYPLQCTNVVMRHIELTGSGSMFAALTIGFGQATGDIHAWIPGDDLYQPGAFEAICTIMSARPDISWIKGYDGAIGEQSEVLFEGHTLLFHRPWIQAGVYGMEAYHISQDASFWRPWLWEKCGPFPAHMKSMGDYWLWLQFAKHAPLQVAHIPVSYFRKRKGQDSRVYAARCKASMWESRGNRRPLAGWIARLFFFPYEHLIPKGMKPFMERLYPYFFPHHNRTYLTIENGSIITKKAATFRVR